MPEVCAVPLRLSNQSWKGHVKQMQHQSSSRGQLTFSADWKCTPCSKADQTLVQGSALEGGRMLGSLGSCTLCMPGRYACEDTYPDQDPKPPSYPWKRGQWCTHRFPRLTAALLKFALLNKAFKCWPFTAYIKIYLNTHIPLCLCWTIL